MKPRKWTAGQWAVAIIAAFVVFGFLRVTGALGAPMQAGGQHVVFHVGPIPGYANIQQDNATSFSANVRIAGITTSKSRSASISLWLQRRQSSDQDWKTIRTFKSARINLTDHGLGTFQVENHASGTLQSGYQYRLRITARFSGSKSYHTTKAPQLITASAAATKADLNPCPLKQYERDFPVGTTGKLGGSAIFTQGCHALSLDSHVEGIVPGGVVVKARLTAVLRYWSTTQHNWVRYGKPRSKSIGPFRSRGSWGWPTIKWQHLPAGKWRIDARVHLRTKRGAIPSTGAWERLFTH